MRPRTWFHWKLLAVWEFVVAWGMLTAAGVVFDGHVLLWSVGGLALGLSGAVTALLVGRHSVAATRNADDEDQDQARE